MCFYQEKYQFFNIFKDIPQKFQQQKISENIVFFQFITKPLYNEILLTDNKSRFHCQWSNVIPLQIFK